MRSLSLPKKLLFVLVLTLLPLLLFEGACSAVHVLGAMLQGDPKDESGASHIDYDPDLGWSSRRNVLVPDMFGPGTTVRTNSQGFRSNRNYFGPGAPLGRLRVVCSGDSFTFGYGVSNEQVWCERLAANEPRFEAVNMGQIGYGLDQAYLWYLRDGIRLEHELHIVAFITPDFVRMLWDDFLGYGKPRLAIEAGRPVARNVPVSRKGYLLPWWLKQRLKKVGELRSVQAVQSLWQRVRPAGPAARENVRAALPLALAVFHDLARINREKGSTLVLLYLPMSIDLASQTSDFWREALASAAESEGWVFIDLVPELRKLDRRHIRTLYRGEGHFTPAGNDWVVHQLLPRLRALPQLAEKLGP
jgi:hypothetical protein